MMRLDKFLAEMNIGTRSQVKALVKQGLVTVNQKKALTPEMKVDPRQDEIACRGKTYCYEKYVYYMMHKPAGVVSATHDKQDKTVLDLFHDGFENHTLFPVGRLDKDTEGLLLLTNDGELAHQLLSPRKHVEKTYYVQLEKPLSPPDIKALTEGLAIGDEKNTLPAKVSLLAEKAIHLTITEGRFHQVKRMLQAVGNQVLYLKRVSMGGLWLDETLEKGHFRKLNAEELQLLKAAILPSKER